MVLCCSLEKGVACVRARVRVTVISPERGHDSPNCILGGTEKPCLTLGHVAHASSQLNNSVVEMEGGNHLLNSTASFVAIRNLTLRGSASLSTMVQCVTDSTGVMSAGLTFQGMLNLSMSSLSVLNCSSPAKTSQVKPKVPPPAVLVADSTNVKVSQVIVSFSDGVGLELTDVGGTVHIRHLMLDGNRWFVDGKGNGGGGLLVTVGRSVSNASYDISFCNFTGNGKHSNERNFFPRKIEHHGRGAGMALYFRDSASHNSFNISDCFFGRNSAVWGGGMSLDFTGDASCNTVYISDVVFSNNAALVSGGGGTIEFVTSRSDCSNRVYLSRGNFTTNEAFIAAGLNIGCSYNLSDTSSRAQDGDHDIWGTGQDEVVIDSTTFTFNHAEAYGGGTGVYASHFSREHAHSLFRFNNCTWQHNAAFFSAGVDISPTVWDATNEGYLPVPEFRDCRFLDNKHLTTHKGNKFQYTGAFVLNAFKVIFSGDTLFHGNNNTALLVVSGAVEVESNSTLSFIENVGNYGGAIQMTGFSFLYISDNCSLLFINNTAQFKGGGMYVSSIDQRVFFSSSGCFIQHTAGSVKSCHNATVLFEGNVDQSGKASSIYTTSLYPCFYHCFNESDTNATIDAISSFDCIANFSFPHGSVETAAHHIELNYSTVGRVIPGVYFQLDSSVIDELNVTHPHELLFISLDNSSMSVAPQYVANNTFQLRVSTPEEVSTSVGLQLHTNEMLRQLSTTFNFTLSYCPPGLVQNDEKCVCSEGKYVGVGCKGVPGVPVLRGGYWTGYINTSDLSLLLTEDEHRPSHLYTTLCAFQHCKHNDLLLDLYQRDKDTTLEELQCSNRSRQGIMCSECKENHSVSFHSQDLHCKKDYLCKLGMLFYALSELLPLIATFLAVVLFNIRFTSGAINGFILTSQLMDATSIGFISSRWNSNIYGIDNHNMNALIAIEAIYRFFNFEFLTSGFCLWKGATSLDVLTFKYTTICFGVVLILVFVLVTRYCNCYSLDRCFQKLNIQKSTIHGLVAFFVMCYGQCTKVTFQILTPVRLEGLRQNGSDIYRPHLSLFSGEQYFHGQHRISCLISFLFFPIIFFPPVLLLVYPLHYKVLAMRGVGTCKLCKKVFGVLDKLKPLLDAFQGCFKDGLRFFAGLYFLYRVAAYGVYMFTGSLVYSHVMLQCVLVLLLALHSLAQPYEKRWHNALDSILLTDLILINSFVLVVLYNTSSNSPSLKNVNSAVSLMIVCKLLPLAYMGSYMTWKGVGLIRSNFCSGMGTVGLPELTHLQESDSTSVT